ncbi:MAG: hypothetical protein FWB74_03400 [Defluviitaleaceae bacterium]|nr:hypothetical protein [Defluviitaleaceae bacterium]
MTDIREINPELKESAALLFSSIGLDLAEAIEMFFKKALAVGEMPFEPVEQELSEREKLNKQLTELIERKVASGEIKTVKLEFDENGDALIDKEKHPSLYDWVVNG